MERKITRTLATLLIASVLLAGTWCAYNYDTEIDKTDFQEIKAPLLKIKFTSAYPYNRVNTQSLGSPCPINQDQVDLVQLIYSSSQ